MAQRLHYRFALHCTTLAGFTVPASQGPTSTASILRFCPSCKTFLAFPQSKRPSRQIITSQQSSSEVSTTRGPQIVLMELQEVLQLMSFWVSHHLTLSCWLPAGWFVPEQDSMTMLVNTLEFPFQPFVLSLGCFVFACNFTWNTGTSNSPSHISYILPHHLQMCHMPCDPTLRAHCQASHPYFCRTSPAWQLQPFRMYVKISRLHLKYTSLCFYYLKLLNWFKDKNLLGSSEQWISTRARFLSMSNFQQGYLRLLNLQGMLGWAGEELTGVSTQWQQSTHSATAPLCSQCCYSLPLSKESSWGSLGSHLSDVALLTTPLPGLHITSTRVTSIEGPSPQIQEPQP